jgi:hypothetical protein
MRYYKIVDSGGFVAGFGTNGATGTEITAEEFDTLAAEFADRSAAPVGKIYVLRDNPREWVLVDAPPEPEPDVEPDEAMEILFGGGAG